jgi:chromosome segregation ATPase
MCRLSERVSQYEEGKRQAERELEKLREEVQARTQDAARLSAELAAEKDHLAASQAEISALRHQLQVFIISLDGLENKPHA